MAILSCDIPSWVTFALMLLVLYQKIFVSFIDKEVAVEQSGVCVDEKRLTGKRRLVFCLKAQ